jgi:putative IMPACT (imprinted ancient) family translation regulator
MLELLRGRELSDVVAVVSRWFGGTLLGTGGLARAYAGATRAALDEVGVLERVLQDLCEVEVDIAAVGQLEHALRSRGARVLGVEYTGEASLRFAIPPVARAVTEEIVAELTAGTAQLRVIGQRWVDSGT